jgi:Zn finger protein HypA/HybF involved in hydrogenase expression
VKIELPPEDPPESAEVHELPLKKRVTDTGKVLQEVAGMKCFHRRFIVDEKAAQCECKDCGEKLNPMWVLVQLSRRENQYHAYHARYHDELKRLSERSKTKCEHCRKMTRISQA